MTEQRLPAISCDPRLYDEGGFQEGAVRLDELRADHARLPGRFETVAPLFGGFAYRRPIDPARLYGRGDTVAALVDHFGWINEAASRGPASALVRVRDALVRDRNVAIRRPEGVRAVYETFRPSDRTYLTAEPAAEAETLDEDGPCLFLESSGSFNYGHWLIDDLSRFAAFDLAAAASGRRPLVLMTRQNDAVDLAKEQSLRAFIGDGPAPAIRFLDPDRTWSIPDLWLPTPVTIHPALKSPRAMDDLASRARRAIGLAGTAIPVKPRRMGHARVYLYRRPERGRALVNDREILDVMQQRRFWIVDAEGHSFLEQAAFMASAGIVVGSMGAAMANTVFCRPGARILHLAPETWTEPFYWDLAAVRGHHYAVCFGETAGAGEPHRAPFRIDPALLEKALDDLA